LTSGKPAAQLSATYDDPQGWYAGGALSAVLASCWQDCGGLQSIAYAGYATRDANDVSWDAGGDFRFSVTRNDYRFGEAYLGVSYRDTSARLYYAPDYFGQSFSAVYAELNQSLPLGRPRPSPWTHRMAAHGQRSYGVPSATRADVCWGASIDVESFELQLTWQHAAAPRDGLSGVSQRAAQRVGVRRVARVLAADNQRRNSLQRVVAIEIPERGSNVAA
jgi:hypothetical protein